MDLTYYQTQGVVVGRHLLALKLFAFIKLFRRVKQNNLSI